MSGQDFKRVGLSTLTDILNVVAPPISEHEVIRVWLSHDMHGYDGIELLTYRSLVGVSFLSSSSEEQSMILIRSCNKSRAEILLSTGEMSRVPRTAARGNATSMLCIATMLH